MKFNFKILILMIFSLTGYFSVRSQTLKDLGSWNILVVKGKIKNNFSFSGEFNMRSNNFHSIYNYSEYKVGVIYSLTRNLGLSVNTGGFNNNTDGNFLTTPSKQKEFRTWEDILLKQRLARLNFDHRGRIEQRFTSAGYKNRIRYRLSLAVPVNKALMTDKTLFLASSDEVFIGPDHPAYEKNRFYGGLGYKLNEILTFQTGIMNQFDYKTQYLPGLHYLQFMITYSLIPLKHAA